MKITLRNLMSDESVALDPHARIEFGAGINRVTIYVVDGAINVSADSEITVSPRASNLIHVQAKSR